MSEKELGQTAYDAAFDDVSPAFADAPPEIRYHWSVIETAVRNAALEQAIAEITRDMASLPSGVDADYDGVERGMERAIRALKRAQPGDRRDAS